MKKKSAGTEIFGPCSFFFPKLSNSGGLATTRSRFFLVRPYCFFTRGNQDKRVPGVRITTLPSRRKKMYCAQRLLMVTATLVHYPLIAA